MRLALAVLLLLNTLHFGSSAGILAVFPFPSKSHSNYLSSIIKTLVRRGHQVVEYSPFPPAKTIPNHTHVEVHTTFEKHHNAWTYEDFQQVSIDSLSVTGFVPIWSMTYGVCEETFRDERIQQLLSSDERFDLVFIEATFGQESFTVFGERFKAKVVTLQAFNLWSGINMEAGNALAVATVPDFPSLPRSELMPFTERVVNAWAVSVVLAVYYH